MVVNGISGRHQRPRSRKPSYAGTTTALQKPTSLRPHPYRSANTRPPPSSLRPHPYRSANTRPPPSSLRTHPYRSANTRPPPSSLRTHPYRSANTRAPTLPEDLTSGSHAETTTALQKTDKSSNPSVSKCQHLRAYLPRGFNLGSPS
jgi:hypothetical protein